MCTTASSMMPRLSVRNDTLLPDRTSWLSCTVLPPGRDTFHQFNQGLPDGELVAELLKSATGPPPKVDTPSASQGHLPPNESPYFIVAAHVAKATADIDMSRTLTPADLSRRLGERRRQAKASNTQYSQDTGHKMFGSSKYVRPLPMLFPVPHFNCVAYLVHQTVDRHC